MSFAPPLFTQLGVQLASFGNVASSAIQSATPALTGIGTLAGAAADIATAARGTPDLTDPNAAFREDQRLEKERIRKRTAGKGLPSRNILTSPQGSTGRANIERKTLLGA